MSTTSHTCDAHCEDDGTLDDADNCTACGATSDGGECNRCGGTRYCEPGCPHAADGPAPAGSRSRTTAPQTERALESWLGDAVLNAAEADDVDATTEAFAEAGIMTNNRGLVVRFGDREFQITIIRSK